MGAVDKAAMGVAKKAGGVFGVKYDEAGPAVTAPTAGDPYAAFRTELARQARERELRQGKGRTAAMAGTATGDPYRKPRGAPNLDAAARSPVLGR